MRKQNFIIMIFLAWGIIFTSCDKKEDVVPGTEIPDDGGNTTTPPPPATGGGKPQVIKCAYTVKATESTIDGSKLNLPPGSVVCIEAGSRGPLYIKNFEGTAAAPITFINSKAGQTVFKGSGPWAVKVGHCKNIRITGSGSSDKYGIIVDGGENGLTLPELTTDFEIDRVEVKNCGFAGIMGKTDPNCNSETWRDNFTMRNISLHDNYIHNVKGEGFYIGNSFFNGKSESCGTVYPHAIEGVKVYKNVVKNVGCEGIQVGCATRGCEIYDNYIESPGQSPFANYQNNGLQIGAGTGGKCYNNIIKNTPGNGMIVNGIGGNVIYNNLIVNSGELGIFCDERTEPKEGYSFINNTIINTGSDGIKLYSEQVPYNNVINNIIINPKTGKYINTSSSVKLTDQNNYFTMDVAAAKFAAASTGDYNLTATSPAINKGLNTSSYGVVKDLTNQVRTGAYDIGAYEF